MLQNLRESFDFFSLRHETKIFPVIKTCSIGLHTLKYQESRTHCLFSWKGLGLVRDVKNKTLTQYLYPMTEVPQQIQCLAETKDKGYIEQIYK